MRKLSRKENIIVGICAVAVLIAITVLVTFSNLRRENATAVSLSRPKAVSNAVWVLEGTDFSSIPSLTDTEGLSSLTQTAQTASDFGFDTVFLKTETIYKDKYRIKYSEKNNTFDYSKKVKLKQDVLSLVKSECTAFSSQSLSVILAVDITSLDCVISAFSTADYASGFIVTGCSEYPAELVNERLEYITATLKSANAAAVVYADFESDKNLDKISLDKEHMTYLAAEIYQNTAVLDPYLKTLNEKLLPTQVGLACVFRCEKLCNAQFDPSADGLLKQVISADECSKLSSRAFHSLSEFISNRDNSTRTVSEYIKNGIDLDKTLTSLELDPVPTQTIETNETVYSFKIRCSDRFSLYINNYCYGVVGENFCNITLDLRHGENKITLYQNGCEVSFTVNCTKKFDSDLVSYITPSDDAYYPGKQTVQITVGAFYKAELKLKLGDKELELTPLGESTGDYTVFRASVKLPKESKKIKDMGKITLEATFDGVSESYDGGHIYVNAKSDETVTSPPTTETTQNTDSYQNTTGISGTNLTPYTYNGVAGTADYITVTSPTAETYPSDPNLPYYNPEYCLWVQGTVDKVVSQSQYTNGDGDTFEMYDLASGRRIVKDDVAFIPSGYAMPDNSVGVISSSSASGFEVKLSTSWRVPYSIDRYSQNYYSGYENKRYNVVSNTVSVIDLVFFNTPYHTGEVDTSSNTLIEKAEWVADAQSGFSILRFYLKKQGGFYGITVSYDGSGNMTVKFKQPKSSLAGKVIIIDPGHGGVQTGATGMNGTVHESEQTLKISKYLAEYLSRAGAAVYMTRTDDTDISLETRRRMTEQIDPDLFISIHLNASENKERSGTCTFYYKSFSQPLAKCIHNRLTQVYKNSCYYSNAQMYSAIDQGANYYPFYVTRTDVCPSVLVEVGFITNDLECAYLRDDAYQQVFAQAIYQGVSDYVTQNN